jgi:hypothetical protein
LEIKALRRLTRDFYLCDMTMDNLCHYYLSAMALKEDAVLQAAEDHTAQHIFRVHETAVVEILRHVDADFFLRCITHEKIDSDNTSSSYNDNNNNHKESISDNDKGSNTNNSISSSQSMRTSLRLSLLTAVYSNLHKHELDAAQFYKLTAASHLPAIEAKAARVLLELEDDICFLERNSKRVTSLQERCISVLGENWDDVCVDPTDVYRVSLPRLQGVALEQFVQAAFSNSKERLNKTEQERDTIGRRGRDDRENQSQQLQQEVESLVKSNQVLERHLQECAKKMEEQQERIAFLEHQERDRLAFREQLEREKSAASDKQEREDREALAAFEQKRHDSSPKTPTAESKSKLTAPYEQAISLPVVTLGAAVED